MSQSPLWSEIFADEFAHCVLFPGYLYSQGLSEMSLSFAYAASGVTGVMATFLFTRLRKRLGLEHTGIIAFSLQISCLVLALASVWAPGSPFDPGYLSRKKDQSPSVDCSQSGNRTLCKVKQPNPPIGLNATENSAQEGAYAAWQSAKNASSALNETVVPGSTPKTSTALFLTGVITSRVGEYLLCCCYFVARREQCCCEMCQ